MRADMGAHRLTLGDGRWRCSGGVLIGIVEGGGGPSRCTYLYLALSGISNGYHGCHNLQVTI